MAGLCFSSADDERLARGYPHLLELTDDLDPKKAPALAAKAGYDLRVHFASLRVRFPRAAANHFVRGARAKEFQDWQRLNPPPASAFADGSPISADEARELVRLTVHVPGCTFNATHRALFYVLEGLVGTEVVVSAILDALEGLPDGRFTKEAHGPDRKTGGPAFLLGFMFERLPPTARAASEKRMRALLDHAHALCAKAGSTSWEVVCPMEEVLDGWAATRVAGKPLYAYASRYAFATDDLDRLRACIADPNTIFDQGYLDVRFVRLLGPEILESLGKRRPRKEAVAPMFEDLGMIKHPAVVSLFLEYVGKPMAKKLPLEWFRAHADYARPILEASRSEKAKAVLASL